ncbi:hypothetical protein C8N43_1569 [Litoreibacter ponti]|uniref:Dolichyl-phosphate-mannose-protein mannosyltransferase n=1 Tax=Litoreibacter ponti TaxID=1510457 RepID=A0A2T6BLF9_9RHOB|nr:hypothetical protein [Litoreibacter ponti]PTX56904.1 hypothetical protein C8N43_1569 [Litoreibacter ponti]
MDNGMDRAGSRLFLVYLLGLIVLLGGLALAKGGLYIDRHEGDTLHLIEIVLRMAAGEWPHIDFVTPLGAMNFLPIVWFVQLGFGIGAAILLAQIAMAILMVPMLWWVARSRLTRGAAYALGGLVMVLALAMIHGEAAASISMSMHYNRWAWGFTFLAVLVAVLEPKRKQNQWFDGVILGFAFSFFVMGKVTFAVALAPGVVLALMLRRQWVAMGTGLAIVAAGALALTIAAGPQLWPSYIGDLLLVSSSNIRPRAGVDLPTLLTAPQYVLGNAVLLLSIIVLRRDGRSDLAAIMLLLGAGWIFITYQNYGNDPKWLALLAVLLPAIARTPQVIALSVVAAAMIAPSFFNMAVSPARHFVVNTEAYSALFAETPYAEAHGDFHTKSERVDRVLIRTPQRFESDAFAYLNDRAAHMAPATFQGEEYRSCVQQLGLIGTSKAIARDLGEVVDSGARVFVADTFANLWMFGELSALEGGAPWYYGGLSGFSSADYFLIPACPATPHAFRAILKDVEARGAPLEKVRETELYTLFKTR